MGSHFLLGLLFFFNVNDTSIAGLYNQVKIDRFCSSSFNLFIQGKDSFCFHESGCEGESNISYGRFVLTKDIIEFIPQEIPYFYGFKIDTLKTGKISFQVVDINEKPLSGQEINIFQSKDAQFFNGFYSNDSGMIYTHFDSLQSFKIGGPFKLKDEWSWIDFKINFPCLITIYYNLQRVYLIYPHVKYFETKRLKFKIKKRTLVDLKSKVTLFQKVNNSDDTWRSHVSN